MMTATPGLRRVFEKYLDLEISLPELRTLLGHELVYECNDGERFLRRAPDLRAPLAIEAAHLQRALSLAIEGRITIDELEAWATFIVLFDGFEVDSLGSGEIVSMLHEIGSPELYGALDQSRLRLLQSRAAELLL